jgi:hypothetical protein
VTQLQIFFRTEQQALLNQSSSTTSGRVSTIATGLNLFTFQGVIATDRSSVVSTLDNAMVAVHANGAVSRLADLAMYGIPAGVTMHDGNLIVAVSAEESGDLLIRVTPSGKVSVIADLVEVCGSFGAPFGVAVGNGFYAVAIAADVSASTGCLVRVGMDGQVSMLADLPGQGIPFGVARWQEGFAVTVERGQLLQVSENGRFSTLVDLTKAGYGIPFGVANHGKQLVLTTNAGYVLDVAANGKITEMANLKAAGFGIPASVAIVPPSKTSSPACLVTTTSGNLLQVNFT